MPNDYKSSISLEKVPFELPGNWTWYKWGDLIAEYQQGLIRSNRQLNGSGIPYLKMNNLDDNGSYNLNKLEHTEVNNDELKLYKLYKNDFLLNVRNSKELVGKTCVIGDHNFDLVFNHMLVRIKHKEGIGSHFINAYLKTPIGRKFIDRCKTGTTSVIALYQRDLYEIPIPLPDDKALNDITEFIETLSKKIALNNRINYELEEIAKTLYSFWFIQFEFPDSNGKPYKTKGGKMIWDEKLKANIPMGWNVEKISEWLSLDKSGDWGKDKQEGNFTKKVICIRGADINALNGLDDLEPPVRYILEKNSFKILRDHDIIIEISGGSPTQSTGRLAFITKATLKRFDAPLICSNFCKPISLKNEKLLYNFVYHWQNLYDSGVLFGYEGKTSGIKNLLLDSFISSYYAIVPETSIVNNFYGFMENIQDKKQIVLEENQKLLELKEWLLPMLMSGQVNMAN